MSSNDKMSFPKLPRGQVKSESDFQHIDMVEKCIESLLNSYTVGGSTRIAVGYSGGLDSTVLLHGLWHGWHHKNWPLAHMMAFHINHQLSPHAYHWQNHCSSFAQQLGIPFQAEQVVVDHQGSVEANARQARYWALEKLCLLNNTNILFSAHHQDDQIETFFLRLLRGSGLTGLVGMRAERHLNHHPEMTLVRPFLNLPREVLVYYAQYHQLPYIEDESNQDCRYTRNRLRHTVIPPLLQVVPQAKTHVVHALQQLNQDYTLLEQYVANDLQKVLLGEQSIDLMVWRTMDELRQMAVLRLWLKTHAQATPSKAQLLELLKQCLSQQHEQKMVWAIGEKVVMRYQNTLRIVNKQHYELQHHLPTPEEWIWQGQTRWLLPNWGGGVYFYLGPPLFH